MNKNSPISFRKVLTLIAALLLLVSLVGCNKEPASDDSSDAPSESAVNQTEATDPTDAPADPTETTEIIDAPNASVMGTVSADNLNVRSNASTDSTVLNQLDIGTRVEIIEQKVVGEVTWGRITEGWINMNYVRLDDEEPEPTEAPDTDKDTDSDSDNTVASGTTGTITASELNIREGAGTTYDSIGKYEKGDKVTILETKNGWGRTSKGWISMKYVSTSDSTTNNNEDEEEELIKTLVTDNKSTVLGYVVVEAEALNVRYGPGTKYDIADKVYEDDRVAYYQEKSGWVRIKSGWISLAYTDKEESTATGTMVTDGKTTALGYVVVNTGALNARFGPGTTHDIADKVYAGERYAYYQKDGNWVRTKEGWISLNYVYVEGNKGDGAGSGTITGDSLNVRTGPGTGYTSTGKMNSGDKVDILFQIKVGDITWGYTGKGWVSMQYVKLG